MKSNLYETIRKNVRSEINKLICEITEEEASDKMRTFKAIHLLKGFLSDPNKENYRSFYPSTSNETRITTYKCCGSQWRYAYSGGKENLINDNFKCISKMWFDNIDFFNNGLKRVQIGEKYNYIKENGRFLLKYWIDYCGKFEEDGFADIEINGYGYYVNEKGQIFSEPYKKARQLDIEELIKMEKPEPKHYEDEYNEEEYDDSFFDNYDLDDNDFYRDYYGDDYDIEY